MSPPSTGSPGNLLESCRYRVGADPALFDLVAEVAEDLEPVQDGGVADLHPLRADQLGHHRAGQAEDLGGPRLVQAEDVVHPSAEDGQRRAVQLRLLAVALDVRVVHGTAANLARSTQTTALTDPVAAARVVQDLMRATDSAGELLHAAALLEARHPRIAEVLRVYGAGRTDEAVEHMRATMAAGDHQR